VAKGTTRFLMAEQFFRMWPRALFHDPTGQEYLEKHLDKPGVYVLYRNDVPYYIGKTGRPLVVRLWSHALRPNKTYYNFWNYFSAFQIADRQHRDEIEAILISAMPTANSAHPKFERKRLDAKISKLLNTMQARMLTGTADKSGEQHPESDDDEN
jgi:hypothetical protein